MVPKLPGYNGFITNKAFLRDNVFWHSIPRLLSKIELITLFIDLEESNQDGALEITI